MQYDTRLSIDTLYFGLQFDDLFFKRFLEEIKNYLFFPLTIDTTRSRSKYYNCEAFNEDCGFFMFFSPHANLANDYATIQLVGKFFREVDRCERLKELIYDYSDFIRYQRVDVALDILWRVLPDEINEFTQLFGFPVPSYSDSWHNVKLPFMIYGRKGNFGYFVNMVGCGRGDLRLRVYDKDLDLYEKYEKKYYEYYGLDTDYQKVYRIEYQMRGKSLKEFCNNCLDLGIDVFDLDQFSASVISCVFNKFKFAYLDGLLINPYYIPTSCKRYSTLEGQIEYHKNKSGFHYFRYRDLQDELDLQKEEEKQVEKIRKQVVEQRADELHTIFDFDMEKFKDEEYRNISSVPY